jgi:hypothetical protein
MYDFVLVAEQLPATWEPIVDEKLRYPVPHILLLIRFFKRCKEYLCKSLKSNTYKTYGGIYNTKHIVVNSNNDMVLKLKYVSTTVVQKMQLNQLFKLVSIEVFLA